MANPFDVFDAPAAPGAGRTVAVSNPFDQFDAPAPAPEGGGDRFALGPSASQTDTASGLGAGLRARADEILVGPPSVMNQAAAAALRASNAAGLNIPRNLGAAIASVPGLGNGRSFSDNYDLARDQEEALARQYPKTALAGTAGGIVGGAVALPAFRAAETAGTFGRGLVNAMTGFGYGAAGEFLDSKDIGEAAKAGGVGAGLGFVGGAAFEKIAPLVTRGSAALAGLLGRGLPITGADGALTVTAQAMLKRAGVPAETLTPSGQALIARVVADKGSSEAAIREGLAAEFGIKLSRGQATGEAADLGIEIDALSGRRGVKAQAVGQDFAQRQVAAIEAAGGRFADRAGRGIELAHPQQAAEAVADRARLFAQDTAETAGRAEREAGDVLAGLRGPAPLDPLDAGAVVAGGLREAAERSRGGYRQAYTALSDLPGEFAPDAFTGLGRRVRERMGTELPVDPVLTPAATRALADLDDVAGILRLPEGTGATAKQVEQVRKRMGALYPSTAQNPTDRAALGSIRSAFDEEVQALAEVGRFGPRMAPARAGEAADGFPGLSGGDGAADTLSAASGAPAGSAASHGQPETLLQYLARNGGVPLDDEARAADLNRLYTPGGGTLARRDAPTWDQVRVRLTEQGFLPYDDAGTATARDLADWTREAIRAERGGSPTVRLGDEGRVGGRAAERVAEENAGYASEVDRQARRALIDLEGVGLASRDVDRAALNEAAEAMVRGEGDDAVAAYDAALARRGPTLTTSRGTAPEEPPFPAMGEGVAPVRTTALPIASPEGAAYAETAGRARAAFAAHKGNFAPRGAGDDVGTAVRKIVDRDAEPVETARLLYGSDTGRATRLADRVRRVVGEGSEAWTAHQQGYISSIVTGADMAPAAVADRIGAALSGPRRGLTYRVLTESQASALHSFRAAARQAIAAREAVPEWITTLGRSDFDANRVMADLYGSGVPGSRPGSASYAGALRQFFGVDSTEWSGLRLAAWQRLAVKPDGSGMYPPRVLAERIREFVDGKGSGLATRLYERDLLAELRRYGRAVQSTVTPDGALRPNGGGSGAGIAGKALDAIATALGFHVGGLPGAGAAYTARVGSNVVVGGRNARLARRSFEGGAPKAVLTLPPPRTDRLAVGSGVYASD